MADRGAHIARVKSDAVARLKRATAMLAGRRLGAEPYSRCSWLHSHWNVADGDADNDPSQDDERHRGDDPVHGCLVSIARFHQGKRQDRR
jgi:hypothetical protein